ncbi:MAG TPA: hypothetical protein VF624_06595 [Tepidisphaeraceae bacterium]
MRSARPIARPCRQNISDFPFEGAARCVFVHMSELTPPPIRFNVAAATLRREFYLLLCGAYDNEWDVMRRGKAFILFDLLTGETFVPVYSLLFLTGLIGVWLTERSSHVYLNTAGWCLMVPLALWFVVLFGILLPLSKLQALVGRRGSDA